MTEKKPGLPELLPKLEAGSATAEDQKRLAELMRQAIPVMYTLGCVAESIGAQSHEEALNHLLMDVAGVGHLNSATAFIPKSQVN